MRLLTKSILSIFLFFSTSLLCISQTNFVRNDAIRVLGITGDTLKNPWAGGFNSVQFSEIDLNLDGIKDLFVFDRSGFRISGFINAGLPNQVNYTHDHSYATKFPTGLKDWVLLRDYNCDGKMDIFSFAGGGMNAYYNTSSTQLSFALDTSLLYSDYTPDAAPSFINMYMSASNIPAIDDIDNDGDLDVLTFNIFGSLLEYHKNLSMERYGNCDSLDYQLTNKCWGYFSNGMNNTYNLFDTCSFNVNNPEDIQPIPHLDDGVTLFTLDVDSNNTKDLVISSYNQRNFNLLINNDLSGNQTASSITSQDTTFPQNYILTQKANINIFPAGFYLDVDNDGIKDLIASPNYPYACTNDRTSWFYENDNANNKPVFKFINDQFLQDGMIEIGEGAHPVFFDHNADGLLDIVIGNHGVFVDTSASLYKSSLSLYENIGTISNPMYQLVDTNYAGVSTLILNVDSNRPTLGLAPTFGDLDGDNDMDMIIGDYNGYIHYFENTAGSGNTAVFNLVAPQYNNINVVSDATPLLYDINKDNLIDLIIGNQLGTFHYYQNTGTAFVPVFNFVTDSLGKVKTRKFFNPRGNSQPFIVDSAGTTFMYSGSQHGDIFKFGNIDGNLNGIFTVLDSSLSDIWEGINSYVSIAEVTNDNRPDMLVGNYAGGIAFYAGDFGLSVETPTSPSDFNIYPNPTNGMVTINLGENNLTNAYIEVLDVLGKKVLIKAVNQSIISINLNNYSKGMYLIKFSNENGSKVNKILIK